MTNDSNDNEEHSKGYPQEGICDGKKYVRDNFPSHRELLIEKRSALLLGSSKNRYGAIWLHFAVRFRENRHKVLYINA